MELIDRLEQPLPLIPVDTTARREWKDLVVVSNQPASVGLSQQVYRGCCSPSRVLDFRAAHRTAAVEEELDVEWGARGTGRWHAGRLDSDPEIPLGAACTIKVPVQCYI